MKENEILARSGDSCGTIAHSVGWAPCGDLPLGRIWGGAKHLRTLPTAGDFGRSGRPGMTVEFDVSRRHFKGPMGFVWRLKSGSELRSKHCPLLVRSFSAVPHSKTGSYSPAWRTYLVDKRICDAPDEWATSEGLVLLSF